MTYIGLGLIIIILSIRYIIEIRILEIKFFRR